MTYCAEASSFLRDNFGKIDIMDQNNSTHDLKSIKENLCDSWKNELEAKWHCSLKPDEKLAVYLSANEDCDRSLFKISRVGDPTTEVELHVPSLRALFRGDVKPEKIDKNPPIRYQHIITTFELRWVGLVRNGIVRIPRDIEMHRYYSELRRRPDGKSIDVMHRILWQIWGFLAATMDISEGEYNAILTKLIHSASIFKTSIASANMYANLLGVYQHFLKK